ncbi:MAG: Vi polysaccharide biosynthesis UDP-N-acetylglucosaminuronic acid C-4 epimerase TviC [Ginsengibacter sp.]
MEAIFHKEDLSSKSFLVTGGAGFIGSHISEYLLINGAKKVRVLDNLSNGFQSNIDILSKYSCFEFIKGDIRDLETCLKATEGIDHVSHQAALGSVPRSIKEPYYTNDVNVGGFVNMLKASVDNKIKTFVYASSSSVYGDEPTLPKVEERIGNCLSPYAVSKRTNELYAQVFANVYGLKLAGFRYFNIFGPRQDPDGPYAAVIPLFVKGILERTPVYINGDGSQTRDFTFVENAVQINIKGMLNTNESAFNNVYNVAIGERFSVNHLYELIRSKLNIKHSPTYRAPRDGDIKNSLANITKAKTLLHYSPTKRFQTGLVETIEYFKGLYS